VTTLDTLHKEKNDRILQIIDKVLNQVFGEEATQFIYNYLERYYSLSRSEFSERIDVFAKGLEDCLSSGAHVIESKILNDISAVYGSLNNMNFGRAERYNFENQMKTVLRKA
jgi:hypothetical protein